MQMSKEARKDKMKNKSSGAENAVRCCDLWGECGHNNLKSACGSRLHVNSTHGTKSLTGLYTYRYTYTHDQVVGGPYMHELIAPSLPGWIHIHYCTAHFTLTPLVLYLTCMPALLLQYHPHTKSKQIGQSKTSAFQSTTYIYIYLFSRTLSLSLSLSTCSFSVTQQPNLQYYLSSNSEQLLLMTRKSNFLPCQIQI